MTDTLHLQPAGAAPLPGSPGRPLHGCAAVCVSRAGVRWVCAVSWACWLHIGPDCNGCPCLMGARMHCTITWHCQPLTPTWFAASLYRTADPMFIVVLQARCSHRLCAHATACRWGRRSHGSAASPAVALAATSFSVDTIQQSAQAHVPINAVPMQWGKPLLFVLSILCASAGWRQQRLAGAGTHDPGLAAGSAHSQAAGCDFGRPTHREQPPMVVHA
jgi:hypothetical protein